MKNLEKGQDKIQKICDQLRRQTLQPAEAEALKIIEEAKKKAAHLKIEAEQQASQLIQQAKGQIEQERTVFQSALQQAAKQTLEGLRQEIEQKLFNEEVQQLIEKQTKDVNIVAELLSAMIKALEKDGLAADLSAVVPKSVSVESVNAVLMENIRQKLKDQPLEVGNFVGGAQVKLLNKKMTIDLSDRALKELISQYIRKDFRNLIFGS